MIEPLDGIVERKATSSGHQSVSQPPPVTASPLGKLQPGKTLSTPVRPA